VVRGQNSDVGARGTEIRGGAGLRTSDVTRRESEDLWIIQPLLEAGLDLDRVRELMVRVSFECIVTDGRCDVSDVTDLLGSQPAAVRAAWITTVDRMLRAPEMSPSLRR
jgi:hypothetical protein